MSTIDNPHWALASNLFATQSRITDVESFLGSKRLTVDPGVCALIVEDGQWRPVGPGNYTIQSLWETLRFWKPKQCTVIITRQQDVVLDVPVQGVPTKESLLVDVTSRMTVQIEDAKLFLTNLMGARPTFSLTELADVLSPLLSQALWRVVGSYSITELTGPNVQAEIDNALDLTVKRALQGYGLRFRQVQAASVHHKRYDEHRQFVGEAWLLGEELATRKKLDDVYNQQELQALLARRDGLDREQLRHDLDVRELEGSTSAATRRLQVRRKWRDAFNSDKFLQLRDENDLETLLLDLDKDRVMREEELASYKEILRTRREDLGDARRRALDRVELEHAHDLRQLKAESEQAIELRSVEHQLRIAELTETRDNVRRREQLQREVERLRAGREQREHDLELEHRQSVRQWELEKEKHSAQVERLRAIGQVNSERDKQQIDLLLKAKETQSNIEIAARDAEARRLAGATENELLALKDPENLADVVKHRASEQTKQAQADRERAISDEKDREIKRMLEQSLAGQDQAKDEQARIMQHAMELQARITEAGYAAMARSGETSSASRSNSGQPGTDAGGDGAHRIMICTQCRAQNTPEQKHCSQCGSRL